MNITIIETVLVPYLSWNWTDNLGFLGQINPERVFLIYKKIENCHQILHIRDSLSSTNNINFLNQISRKRILPIKSWKNEHHHRIVHIRISLSTKFQLIVIVLIFWTRFAQKGCFHYKTKKLNTTVDFCIYKLVQVPNLSLNWQLWVFGSNLLKKGISGFKQKKWKSPLNSAYSNNSRYQISVQTDNFESLEQIWLKKAFLAQNRKDEHQHSILHIQISLSIKFHFIQFWILGPNLPKKGVSGLKQKKWTSALNSAYLN